MLAVFVPRASAAAEITFQTFYDGLSPYGDWVEIDDYGYCWQPWVDSGWAPYTDGEWANTDSGWTWVSNEDFGWATYHYGRWMQVSGRGWVWVPGYEWGPGWVFVAQQQRLCRLGSPAPACRMASRRGHRRFRGPELRYRTELV